MNQETIEAIKELENGEGKRFTGSTKELFRELISEHIPAEKENVKKMQRRIKMPTLSYFYGIYIKMYFQRKEHNPPHFHAIYGEYTGEIEIKTLKQIEGDLPPKAMELIKEWGELHKEELQKIWDTQEFIKISPLE